MQVECCGGKRLPGRWVVNADTNIILFSLAVLSNLLILLWLVFLLAFIIFFILASFFVLFFIFTLPFFLVVVVVVVIRVQPFNNAKLSPSGFSIGSIS